MREKQKYILIAGAWPYANGSLHIGHIAGLLPGDVLARYYRAKGEKVCYVSGSDCHGTPVSIRARKENRTPEEISDFYHEEFKECFKKLGFSYDCYSKTSSGEHIRFVKEFHKRLYQSPYVYEKEAPQAYCEGCGTFLADRFVTGKCPKCGESTRGDQCDACGEVLDAEQLQNAVCAVCGKQIVFRGSKHLYIALSKLQQELQDFVKERQGGFRKNAAAFTDRYLKEGLRDRALTRDLDWGIDVPKEGYEGKKIYIWAENVLGYLSLSCQAAKENGEDFKEIWGPDARHYYVHGKDNIPFHTIILPALLIAEGGGCHLPDDIISSEYLTLQGKKVSTSLNYAIWIKDIVCRFEPDSLRYYLLANGAEKRDGDFSWKGYVTSHNGELLGGYGNFVNRTLSFIVKYLGGIVPEGKKEKEIGERTDSIYASVGKRIERGQFRDAIDEIFALVRFANKYFDSCQPWITRNADLPACQNTLYNCVQIIACLATVLEPFLPFSSEKVKKWLGLSDKWEKKEVLAGYKLPAVQVLFQRIDKKVIEEEEEKLKLLTCRGR